MAAPVFSRDEGMQEPKRVSAGGIQVWGTRIGRLQSGLEKDPARYKIAAVWAMHYLFKGAPYTSLDRRISYSPLHTRPEEMGGYYRSQGGFIQSIFADCVQSGRDKNQFLLQNKQLIAAYQFVKGPQFKNLLAGHFDYREVFPMHMEPVEEGKLEPFLQELRDQIDPRGPQMFVDLSPLFSGLEGRELQNRLEEIRQTIYSVLGNRKKIYSKVVFGGILPFVQPDKMHVALVLNIGQVNRGEMRLTLGKLGSLGYLPDIVEIEEVLVEKFRFTPKRLLKDYRIVPAAIEEEQRSISEISHDISTLLSASSKEGAYQFYLSLLQELFASDLQPPETFQDRGELVKTSLQIIETHLKQIEEAPLERFLNKIDLIFEEVSLIVQLLSTEHVHLRQTIQKLATISEMELTPKAFVHTSGMNAYSQLIPALSKEKSGKKLQTLFANSSYFELLFVQNSQLKERLDVIPFSLKGETIPLSATTDAIFLDLFPNDATKKTPSIFRYKETLPLESVMVHETPGLLTLVVDTSTTLFYHEAVQEMVQYYEKALHAGKLRIVLVNSLAKFAMCGLDKYTGGTTIVYGGDPEGVFLDTLRRSSNNEPLSWQATTFFNLFLGHPEKPLEYMERINKNVQLFKKQTDTLRGFQTCGKGGELLAECFHIPEQHPAIPYLSIHFRTLTDKIWSYTKGDKFQLETGLATLIHNYILLRAKIKDLPLSKRMSFGFAHSNLTECKSAVRWTVGLESEATLEKYAAILHDLNAQLATFMSKRAEANSEKISRAVRVILSRQQYDKMLHRNLGYELKGSPPTFRGYIDSLFEKLQIPAMRGRGRGFYANRGGRGRVRGRFGANRGRYQGSRGKARTQPSSRVSHR